MGLEINGTFLVITIVLLALIILTLIIMRYGKLLNQNAKDDGNNVRIDDSSNNVAKTDNEADSATSNEELIAVLTAAIAASFSDSFANGFRVKSFKRVPQSDSLWNSVARNEQVLGKLQF